MAKVRIEALSAAPAISGMLSDLLIETVANGGSVSFMHPLDRKTARAFWDESLASAARGERVVLGAWDGGLLVGTVTLLLNCPPNQPHRAEISKMMTRVRHRGRGIATMLMQAAEACAVERAHPSGARCGGRRRRFSAI
jgi:GNAT superfamily N-acetyltransferase